MIKIIIKQHITFFALQEFVNKNHWSLIQPIPSSRKYLLLNLLHFLCYFSQLLRCIWSCCTTCLRQLLHSLGYLSNIHKWASNILQLFVTFLIIKRAHFDLFWCLCQPDLLQNKLNFTGHLDGIIPQPIHMVLLQKYNIQYVYVMNYVLLCLKYVYVLCHKMQQYER